VLASPLSFKTHSKNTSKSGDAVFYMARKCLIFSTFKFLKKIHETPWVFMNMTSIFMSIDNYECLGLNLTRIS
jgi:hypothetical protein